MNTNKTESIRFFWNGIKVNGGKLIRCFYFTDSDSVTISACDYDSFVLFGGVDRGQKKGSSSGTDTAGAAFFVAGGA